MREWLAKEWFRGGMSNATAMIILIGGGLAVIVATTVGVVLAH